MKLLNSKQQNEILKRIAECQNICNDYIDDVDVVTRMTENLADIAIEVAGNKGATRVIYEVDKYNKIKEVEE